SRSTLGVRGMGASPQSRDQRLRFVLWSGSTGQYIPLLSSGLSVRARLDVRVSLARFPAREDDSSRRSQGDASSPLRDLSRRGSVEGDGETVVEWRGYLANGLSARLSHFRSQLAGEAFVDPDAR